MKKSNLEVEVRFKIVDMKAFWDNFRVFGAQYTENWNGKDIIFDNDKKELVPSGRLLRLRLGMEPDKRGKLTFKNPYQKHALKIREEFESVVENAVMIVKILENLGYKPILQYEKRTELWKCDDTEIYIENLPVLGFFMEIEGAKRNIRKIAKILGFDVKKDGIKKSYREMFAEIDKDKKEWFF